MTHSDRQSDVDLETESKAVMRMRAHIMNGPTEEKMFRALARIGERGEWILPFLVQVVEEHDKVFGGTGVARTYGVIITGLVHKEYKPEYDPMTWLITGTIVEDNHGTHQLTGEYTTPREAWDRKSPLGFLEIK